VTFATAADTRDGERKGSAACVACHPLRDQLLQHSVHADLASNKSATACEDCHGNGALHIESNGLARLITRPDRARDGVATCRSCHPTVDAERFHWKDKQAPMLTAGVTCTTCHQVHASRARTCDGDRDGDSLALHPDWLVASGYFTPQNRDCAKCHAPAACTMPGSTHSSLGALDSQFGCSACHGDGLAHIASGGRKQFIKPLRNATAAQQADTCLACHRDSKTLAHVQQGTHQRHGIGCLECHGPIHGAERMKVAEAAEQNCKRCHADV